MVSSLILEHGAMSDKGSGPGPSNSKKMSANESQFKQQDSFCGLYHKNVCKTLTLSVVELRKTSFTMNVRNTFAEVNFQQTYRAPTGNSDIEAFFLISKKFKELNLYHLNVKCSSWEMMMDIKSLEEAQIEYAASMNCSNQIEDDDATQFFKIRIGFLKPNQWITVELYFLATLKSIGSTKDNIDNGLVALCIPISLSAAVPVTTCRLKEIPINGIFKIESKNEIIDVFSPSHPENFKMQSNIKTKDKARTNLGQTEPQLAYFNSYEIPHKSFVLAVRYKAPSQPSILLEEMEINGIKSVAVMVHVFPEIRNYKVLKTQEEKLDAVVLWKDDQGHMLFDRKISLIQVPTVLDDYYSRKSLEFMAIVDEPEKFSESLEIVLQTQDNIEIYRFQVKLSEAMIVKPNISGLLHRYAMASIMKENDASPIRRQLGFRGAMKYGIVVDGSTVVPVNKYGQGICFNWFLPKPVVAKTIETVEKAKDDDNTDEDTRKEANKAKS